jgi:predicted nuclease of predicted toxin-antitoxin system
MRLLFDEHISAKLVDFLQEQFPDSLHVTKVDLQGKDDIDIWNYARENNYCIVTKDADFNDISSVKGFPPVIVWVRIGNCTTNEIASVLKNNSDYIKKFMSEGKSGIIELFN